MKILDRALLAAAVAIMAITALTSSAATATARPGRAISAVSLGLTTFASSVINMTCSLTMNGTANAGPITLAASAVIGSITQVLTACNNGIGAEALNLPWDLVYQGGLATSGSTSFLFTIRSTQILLRVPTVVGALLCLFSGPRGFDVALSNGRTPYATGLVTSQRTTLPLHRDLGGALSCPPEGSLQGAFSLAPQQTITVI